jgi:hypothetical protein
MVLRRKWDVGLKRIIRFMINTRHRTAHHCYSVASYRQPARRRNGVHYSPLETQIWRKSKGRGAPNVGHIKSNPDARARARTHARGACGKPKFADYCAWTGAETSRMGSGCGALIESHRDDAPYGDSAAPTAGAVTSTTAERRLLAHAFYCIGLLA